MGRLEAIAMADLQGLLEDVEDKKPTLRLVVGINYKRGISQTELAEWYGVSRTTIHNWLTRLERLETEPPSDVLYDADRPGRPAKLTPPQRARLSEILDQPPSSHGFVGPEWSAPMLDRILTDEFDVTYSQRHVREILQSSS